MSKHDERIEYQRPDIRARLKIADRLEGIAQLDDESVQLAIFSSPYPGQRGFDMTVEEYLTDFLPATVIALRPKLRRTAVVVQNVNFKRRKVDGFKFKAFDSRLLAIPSVVYEPRGFFFVAPYIWDKLNAPPSGYVKKFDRMGFEFVFVFAVSDEFTFNAQRVAYAHKTRLKSKNKHMRRADVAGSMTGGHANLHEEGARTSTVVRFSSSGGRRKKAQRAKGGSFPVSFARHFIRLFSDPDDLVVDPFVGAGSSAIASVSEGRRFFGCDTDEDEITKATEFGRRIINRRTFDEL